MNLHPLSSSMLGKGPDDHISICKGGLSTYQDAIESWKGDGLPRSTCRARDSLPISLPRSSLRAIGLGFWFGYSKDTLVLGYPRHAS